MPDIGLHDIHFDTSIYPREKWRTSTVSRYVDCLKRGDQFAPYYKEFLQREAKTTRLDHSVPEAIFVYTDVRWIGFIEKGVIWYSNHDTSLCRNLWKEYLNLLDLKYRRKHKNPKEYDSEKAFVDDIVLFLESEGWKCTREVHAKPGRIDIMATRQDTVWLIEAKLQCQTNDIAHALGRLLFVAPLYPTAHLWIATPSRPTQLIIQRLEKYNIALLEGPWNS